METIEYQAMFDQEQRFWWYRALHNITLDRIQQLQLPADSRLLDAGCGTGGLLQKLHGRFPTMQLTGLEYNPAGLALIQVPAGIDVVSGNVNAMPFPDDYFDVIVMNDVLYHRSVKPADCLAECRRILKPGGTLLVNVSAYNWMRSAHDRQVHTRERYTAHTLGKQLSGAGLHIWQLGYWNSLLFPLMALHRLTLGRLKTGSDVESLPAWLDNLFFRIIQCEAVLQRYHIYLPFGGSVWARTSKP